MLPSSTCTRALARTSIAGLLVLAPALSAQGWVHRYPGVPDISDLPTAVAFDELRGRIVIWKQNVLWEWSGNEWWRRAAPQTLPSPDRLYESAYDSIRHRLVLFGGQRNNVSLDETWEYDGVDWVRLTPAISPAARIEHRCTFDRRRGRVVMFGGSVDGAGASPCFGDTWEWDGSTWQQRMPPAGPGPRCGVALAYDSLRDRTVLHGGRSGLNLLTDTWEWDGTTWQLQTGATPPPSNSQAATFDARRGRVVLVQQGSGIVDTWEWDGRTWSDRSTPGWGWFQQRLVYDSLLQRVLAYAVLPYGGGEVRAWDGTAWNIVDGRPTPSLIVTSALVWDSRRSRALSLTSWAPSSLFLMSEWDGQR